MFRRSLKNAAVDGLPIYAECGGFMYLGESLTVDDQCYEMVGALPVKFGMEKRPQGHGYTELEVDTDNPFFALDYTGNRNGKKKGWHDPQKHFGGFHSPACFGNARVGRSIDYGWPQLEGGNTK